MFLPNLGSVALFLFMVIIQTLLAPLGILLTKIGIRGKWNLFKKMSSDSDTLSNEWLRIMLEIFISGYMFLLLGFQMLEQIPPENRNAFDEWSVSTQYILMVPTFGFPLLIIWFAVYHSRWLVKHHKAQFYEENKHII